MKLLILLTVFKIIYGFVNLNKIKLTTPNQIINTYNVFNTINNNVLGPYIKDNFYSPILYKESIYIPIIGLFVLNEYLNFRFKKRNRKLNTIDSSEKYTIKRSVNFVVFIINFILTKDIENAI